MTVMIILVKFESDFTSIEIAKIRNTKLEIQR